jgi:uncharacterized RDD family membrane protein YckC
MKPRLPIYAGRLERLFANLIDTIILVIPGGLLSAALGPDGLGMLAMFAISVAYYTYFTASSWQATPGKRLLGIYVMRTDHRMLGPRDALERFLAYTIPSLPIYTSLISPQIAPLLVFWLSLFWFAPILFTPERMGMHDRLCRTRVLVGRVGI